jgi:hypothetical protein
MYLSDQVLLVIGIVPQACQFDGIEAEAIAIDYLYSIAKTIDATKGKFWSKKLREACDKTWVVLRPVLIKGDDYANHLEALAGWSGQRVDPRIPPLLREHFKKLYWMVEISYSELFPANRRKLGEILLNAEIRPTTGRNYQSFVLARLPENFYFLSKITSGVPSYTTLPTRLDDHIGIYHLSSRPS